MSSEEVGEKQTDPGLSPNSGTPPLRPWANQVTYLSPISLPGLKGEECLMDLAQDGWDYHGREHQEHRTQTVKPGVGVECGSSVFRMWPRGNSPPPGDQSKVQTQIPGGRWN